MIYKATQEITQELLKRPESGMGYQLIEGDSTQRIVFNAELLIDLDKDLRENMGLIESRGFDSIVKNTQRTIDRLGEIRIIGSISSSVEDQIDSVFSQYKRVKGGKAAKENASTPPTGKDNYVRLSAYANDRRIDSRLGRLLPGSYTTNEIDYQICKTTGDDPIDRYSLPNNEEIKWAFYILPDVTDMHRIGIVQPEFSHLGGGFEALFDNGTSIRTVLKKTPY